MRILVVIILVLVTPLWGYGAPHLVSDKPAERVESCVLDGIDLPCELAADGSIHTDLAALPPGSYTVKAKYCVEKGLWCSEWSNPFSFAKPVLTPPAAIGLSR